MYLLVNKPKYFVTKGQTMSKVTIPMTLDEAKAAYNFTYRDSVPFERGWNAAIERTRACRADAEAWHKAELLRERLEEGKLWSEGFCDYAWAKKRIIDLECQLAECGAKGAEPMMSKLEYTCGSYIESVCPVHPVGTTPMIRVNKSMTFEDQARQFFNGYIELVRDYQPKMKPEQFIQPLAELLESAANAATAQARAEIAALRGAAAMAVNCHVCDACRNELERVLASSQPAREQKER